MKLVTIEYVERNKEPHIILFTREDRKRKMIDIPYFKPYFFVPTEGHSNYKTLDGTPVTKLETILPQEVGDIRDNYEKTWESDVHFTTRYLIDEVPKIEKTELRIQYTDIEKDMETDQIIAISAYDNYLNKCVCFAWKEGVTEAKVDREFVFPKSGYKFPATVHIYRTRNDMLKDYVRFVRDTDPDILTGWFFVQYDAKELIQELKNSGLGAAPLSPLDSAYIIGDKVNRHTESNIKIKGRVLWDMLKAYSALQPTRLLDSSLEAISQEELGEGKEKLEKSISWNWKNDFDKFVEYNAMDAVLVYRIDQKKHLLDYYDSMRRWIGCEWEQLFSETLLWDTYILRKVHGKVVLPRKKRIDVEKFKGALVFTPASKGVHRWVMGLDFKCHPEGTIVDIKDKGRINISEVKPNDFVFGINGWHKVKAIHKYLFNGDLVKINNLLCTPNHRIPVYNKPSYRDIKASQFSRHYVRKSKLIKTNVKYKYYDRNSTGWLLSEFMGIFLAEGSLVRNDQKYYSVARKRERISHIYRVTVTVNSEENELIDRILYISKMLWNYIPRVKAKGESKGVDIIFTKKDIYTKVNALYLNLRESSLVLEAILSGFFEGDGSINSKRNSIQLSQSQHNNYTLKFICEALEKLNIKYNLWVGTPPSLKGVGYGPISYLSITRKESLINFLINIDFISRRKGDLLNKIINKKIWKVSQNNILEKPVNITKEHYNGYVYDLTLEGEPYYYANGILTHNSLYPSIIMTLNMSPETVYRETNEKVINFDINKKLYKLENGITFLAEPRGIFPTILEEMIIERKKYQAEMSKYAFDTEEWKAYFDLQTAVKVMMNALYGASAYANFRLVTPEIASSITFMGRKIIDSCKKEIEKDFKVLYGDTDSLYLFSYKDNLEEIMEEANALVTRINIFATNLLKEYGVEKSFVKIELKKVYETFIMSDLKTKPGTGAKKRYAGRVRWADNPTDKLEVVGFESKRSDSSIFSRRLQKEVLRLILYGEEEKVKAYIQEAIRNISKLDLEEVGIPRGLSRKLDDYETDNPWLRGSVYSNTYLNTSFGQGDKPKVVYVRGCGKYPRTDVVAFTRTLPKDFVVDYDIMIEKDIIDKVEHILDAAGMSIDDVLTNQGSLDKF